MSARNQIIILRVAGVKTYYKYDYIIRPNNSVRHLTLAVYRIIHEHYTHARNIQTA